MSTSIRVKAIGRGLVYISFLLIALRLAKYLVIGVTVLAGYVGGVLLVAGIFIWFVGNFMVGYTERHQNNHSFNSTS